MCLTASSEWSLIILILRAKSPHLQTGSHSSNPAMLNNNQIDIQYPKIDRQNYKYGYSKD